jgi:hypothetical protein
MSKRQENIAALRAAIREEKEWIAANNKTDIRAVDLAEFKIYERKIHSLLSKCGITRRYFASIDVDDGQEKALDMILAGSDPRDAVFAMRCRRFWGTDEGLHLL